MPVAECLKLLEINLIRQDTQCVVSRLLVTQAAQGVDQPLPAYPWVSPKPCLDLTRVRGVGRAAAHKCLLAQTARTGKPSPPPESGLALRT